MKKGNSGFCFVSALSRLLKYILFLALFVFIAAILIQKVRNFDIWWHLKTGEYILTHHSVPKFDIFSYTAPTHRWVNHQWLADILFFSIFSRFGVNGLIILKAALLGATFGILLAITYCRKLHILSAAAVLLAVLASSHRFLIRPFMFNLFFSIVYFYILRVYKYKNKKFIFLLPILQIFWTNLHGGSLIGLILIFSYLIGEILTWKLNLPFQWKDQFTIKGKKYYILLGIAGLTILANIINPNWLTGALYPFLTLTELNKSGYQQVVMKYIAELKPPFTIYNLFKIHPYPYYKLLILGSLAAFTLNFRRLKITHLLIYTIFLFFSLKASRNISTFAILAIPISAFNIYQALESNSLGKVKAKLSSLAAIRTPLTLILQTALIVFLVILTSKATAPQYSFKNKAIRSFGFGILEAKYPKGAIDFIEKNHIQGNVFNTYKSGGYFIWRCYPKRKVFIDGRTEVYGPRFYENYVNVTSNPEKFDELAKRLKINYILLTRVYSAMSPFLTYVYKSPDWKLVYFDETSIVLVKDSSLNREIIKKYENTPSRLKEAPLQKPAKGIFPFTLFKKGEFLRAIELYDEAIFYFKQALRAESEEPLIYNNIGIVYHQRGLYQQAENEFLKAVKLNPNYAEAHNNLGSTYARQNLPNKAIAEFKAAIGIDSSYANAYLNLGMAYAKTKQNKEAIRQYKKALRFDPGSLEIRTKLGVALYEERKWNEAIKEFKKILELSPNSALAHNNLGVIYNAMGKKDEAIAEWKETLRLNPNHKEAKSNIERRKN